MHALTDLARYGQNHESELERTLPALERIGHAPASNDPPRHPRRYVPVSPDRLAA